MSYNLTRPETRAYVDAACAFARIRGVEVPGADVGELELVSFLLAMSKAAKAMLRSANRYDSRRVHDAALAVVDAMAEWTKADKELSCR
jgi:hypothetical protein